MDIFVSHGSALAVWRLLAGLVPGPKKLKSLGRARTGIGNHRRCEEGEYLEAFNGSSPCDGLALTLARDIATSNGMLDLLVRDGTQRRSLKGTCCHVWPYELPPRAFIRLDEHLYVSSPEFLFMQMASSLDLVHLIELGYELAGTYTRASAVEGGIRPRGLITSVGEIEAAVDAGGSFHGAKLARRAVGHVLDGSASPMETILAMLLSLPRAMGGYGFEPPELNGAVEVVGPNGAHVLHTDLLYRSRGFALEYEGAGHATREALERDSMRRSSLVSAGVEVITVTSPQVYQVRRMDEIAALVAARLGMRMREPSYDPWPRKMMLRTELLHPDDDDPPFMEGLV